MKKQFAKRLLAMIMCIMMVAGVFPTTALATETSTEVTSTEVASTSTEATTVEESSEATSATTESTEQATEASTTEVTTAEETTTEAEEPSSYDVSLASEDEIATIDDTDSTVIIAGSDFQNSSGHSAGAVTVQNILNEIKEDYSKADGFLFAGDYDYNYTDSANGKASLQSAVQKVYTELDSNNMIFIQGNHDSDDLVGSTLSTSGEHDNEKYGVFVINEKDYMWYNKDKDTVKETAQGLESYLNKKVDEGYNKPIFVMSHLPLHYSMRTLIGGGDGKYANYIFDVLNEAGANGLNIIFMFGHNHSHGWDDYLGGAAIYLEKGDTINIAQASTSNYETETLNFTYLNAGYVGYYGDTGNDSDQTLTMTTFEIDESNVIVKRYDEDGEHVLKASGVYGGEYSDNKYANPVYEADTNSYESSQTITLTSVVKKVTQYDEETGVSVTAPGLTGLTVSKNADVVWDTDLYSVYASYNIVPTGYTQGDSAEVVITIPDTFDTTKKVKVIDKETGSIVEKSVENGTVTFVTTHFSTYDLAQTKTVTLPSTEKTVYRLVDQFEDEKTYLIVSSNTTGTAYALQNTSGISLGPYAVTIKLDTTGAYIETAVDSIKWKFINDTTMGVLQNLSTNRYLRAKNGSTLTTTSNTSDNCTSWRIASNDYGMYTLRSYSSTSTRYYAKYSSGFYVSNETNSSQRLYIYEEVKEGQEGATVTIDKTSGTVKQNAKATALTGSKLTLTYSDGTTETVYVTLEMLKDADGNAISTGTAETLTGLTLLYNGVVICTNYSLTIRDNVLNNYPEYPDEGAVRVNKTGEGIDFQSSGIAKVELSATGIPVKKGADVIVMLDTSSSMNDNTVTVNGVTKTRLQVMKESLKSMLEQFQATGEDGQPLDIRLAVADFNGYYTDSSSPYYINSEDHLKYGSIRTNAGNAKVYTGSYSLNAEAFVEATSLNADTAFANISYSSGTNYDYAFDAVYQLGEAISAQNASESVERDLFVIFMSDGAPFQYNYFSAQSGSSSSTTSARYWNNWLQGTLDDNMKYSNANNTYYNADGKHWMAEAIKGDTGKEYDVIRKNNSSDTDGDTWVKVSGLGATMYSIGFCLAVDKEITVASMQHVLKNISSDSSKYYYEANSAEELDQTFTAIGKDIAYAATNARFVDTMGSNYDLQLKTSTYTVVEDGDEKEKSITPVIEVKSYDIYTRQDFIDGKCTESQIGDRKGTYTVLETVTFNTSGTEAYSSVLGTGNILDGKNGLITANTFWYNTSGNTVQIDTDGDGTTDYALAPETFYWKIGTIQTSELALSYYVYLTGSMEGTRTAGSYPTNESAVLYYDNYLGNACQKDTVSPVLAWKSANVSYAFYLVDDNGNIIVNQTTGQTGSFANKVAITNPVVYKEILLNNTDQVNSINVASLGVLPEGYSLYDEAAVYEVTIDSNSTGSWEITKGADVVATTYVTNFSNTVQYSNALEENSIGNDYTHTVVWFAVKYQIKAIPDAVVIDYGLPVDISVLSNDMFGDYGKLYAIGSYDLMFEKDEDGQYIKNELTGEYEKVESDGKYTKYEYTSKEDTSKEDTSRITSSEYDANYGDVTVDLTNNKVRYTPDAENSMQMSTYDKFAYAAEYTGAANKGYYYSTVTVIPATTIYYEESFVTFVDSSEATDSFGKWGTEGTTTTDATQDEDRPGEFSITADANNLYGYDSAYTNYTQYSLGSAKKVKVDASTGTKTTAPTATFKFKGTGFDIISLTDSDSGVIRVTVEGTDKNGNTVKKTVSVDNYYGYTYNTEKNSWEIKDKEDGKDTIWQVPVIKVEGLVYGTYTATIQVAYLKSSDHVGDGSYSFWLDAIRIYDPAKDDATANAAYSMDTEKNPYYITLRDLLVGTGNLGDLGTDTGKSISGVVFIDGIDAVYDIDNYANPGPNNETYLAYQQGVAFKLTTEEVPKSVQLGIKLAYGDSATLKQNNADFVEVKTATDMYYELPVKWNEQYSDDENEDGETVKVVTGYESDVIILSNSVNGSVISITNLKTIGSALIDSAESISVLVDEEVLTAAPLMMSRLYSPVIETPDNDTSTKEDTTDSDTSTEEGSTENNDSNTDSSTEDTTTPESGNTSTDENKPSTNKPSGTVTKPGTDESVDNDNKTDVEKPSDTENKDDNSSEETKKVFTPKHFKVKVQKKKVRVGQKYKVVVTTSKNVKFIKVNGKKYTKYKLNKKTGIKTWTVKVKATKAGKRTVKVKAYNKKKLASKTIKKTITVLKKTKKSKKK